MADGGVNERRLRVHGAGLSVDERNRNTGTVELRAIPLWLKGEPIIRAELTAKEARSLAIALLRAAEALA